MERFRKIEREELERWIMQNANVGNARLMWSKLMGYCMMNGIRIGSLEEIGIKNYKDFEKLLKKLNII